MGAQTFRSGIVVQKQVVDLLNEHFVCIEYDPSLHDGIPAATYPGLGVMADNWNQNPWTRVSFGVQWVLEPEGQYLLAVGSKAPAYHFESKIEEGLKRFIRIRSHPRGSAAEAEEISLVKAEVSAQAGRIPQVRTKEIFNKALGALDERFAGVLAYPDPKVRAGAAELLGIYAEDESDPGFRPGGRWESFGSAVAECLEDEDGGVRLAAAKAMHRFFDRPSPEVQPEELVATARGLWAAEPAALQSSERAE